MQKQFVLQGLGCANCAAKIELAAQSLDGISSANVNFMTTTLTLETKSGYYGDIMTDVENVVHKYEPDVVVIDKAGPDISVHGDSDHCGCGHDHGGAAAGKGSRGKIVQLVLGAAVFAAGILLDRLVEINDYTLLALFLASYAILGGEVLLKAAKNIARGQIFDENFLMSVATIGAFALGDYPEAVAVMLFYQVGEYFQDLAVRRSKKSIADLMDIRPDYANVKRNGEIVKVPPDMVSVGDIIVVKPGEKIPLDGVIIEGVSALDTKALTGESLPREVGVSDNVLSGCINKNGLLTVKVTKVFGESTVQKIIDLVENAGSRKAPTENFITKFSRYYTPVVVGLALLLAVVPPLFTGGDWADWIHRGLIFLVISCPCALVISIPLSFFGGIGGASRRGILVKGGNYLEALNNLDTVVFDKTGTLTKGDFEVTSLYPASGFNSGELLEFAAWAEAFSTHPIAESILRAYGKTQDRNALLDYREIAGHGTGVTVNGIEILAGNARLMKKYGIGFEEPAKAGTKVYIAAGGRYAGCIVIADEVKPDSRAAISALKERGVRKTVMLTGDSAQIGLAVAKELGLDEVYSELLPYEKVEKLELLDAAKAPKGKLAYVGDGINDAPVLARADIGIAMGGLGSDAAIEAADIVLMTDEPSKLAVAVDIARKTNRIVRQNIVFALGVKGIFLLLGAFGIATMWEAVFADVGVALIAIINAMRAMKE